MPRALLALAIGAFGIGTTEFVVMGMLPDIAAGLDVSVPAVGLLISAYAVGMEAHGSPLASLAQKATAVVPDAVMEKVMQVVGVDRLAALNTAIEAVRRGGTISLSGVYGGATDPLPLMRMFDKQIQLRMGQANVLRWVPDILPLLLEGDPLGVDDFATHRVPLEEAPQAYMNFREKKEGTVKVLLKP